jgi:hypothetical protein
MAAIFVGGCVRRWSIGGESARVEPASCARRASSPARAGGRADRRLAFAMKLGRYDAPPPSALAQWASVALLAACCAVLYRAGSRRGA